MSESDTNWRERAEAAEDLAEHWREQWRVQNHRAESAEALLRDACEILRGFTTRILSQLEINEFNHRTAVLLAKLDAREGGE
jgi:hypothetical protein